MQINLTLTVNLEPTELTPIVAAFLGQFHQMASQATQTAPDAIQGPELPATTSTPVLPAIAPATDEASSAPDAPTEPMSTFIHNTLAAHGLVPLDWTSAAAAPADSATEATLNPPAVPPSIPAGTQPRRVGRSSKPAPAKRPGLLPGEKEPSHLGKRTGDRLPFDQFDQMVRAEMKRLSMDRRIPSYRLWDTERDSRLPTLGGVIQRYGCTNLVDFAEKIDMLPPLSALGSNGVKAVA